MSQFLFSTMLLILVGVQSAAAVELQGVLQSIASRAVKSSNFTETRTAYFLEKPIVIEGSLEFRSPDILIKRITGPEMIEQYIEGEILSIFQNKNITKTISLERNPELAAGVNAIRWVLSGNLVAINENFVVSFKSDNAKWRIGLIPKDLTVADNIERILITGNNEYITAINIVQVNGDSIKTDLYGQY